ncbi:unnamed protein product [Vitrella brassicaformis CCMP3155]|uniref:non-specific serine/threonine protein kinase n=1 Tax=Vitrella brassicaformis (strain CCMP3155) TaxID=1169540 RepID=A0A0G4G5S6_VITBC|nr:unnamed protein product [Vitrella brassicaformis CCMP3155]|eukprot:CEM23731.1 unnamed protein product [Vitrella brassicaformis CCMP3155]
MERHEPPTRVSVHTDHHGSKTVDWSAKPRDKRMPECVYVVMERCHGVPLPEWWAEGGLSLDARRSIVMQLLLPVNRMHASKLVHADIKADNCLFDGTCLKLVDYQLCATERALKAWRIAGNQDRGGTREYTAPEEHLTGYTAETDLWAVGVMLQALLYKDLPFPELKGITDREERHHHINSAHTHAREGDGPKPTRSYVNSLLLFLFSTPPLLRKLTGNGRALSNSPRSSWITILSTDHLPFSPPPPPPQPFVGPHPLPYAHFAPPAMAKHCKPTCFCPSTPPTVGFHVETRTKVPDGKGGWRVVHVERHEPPTQVSVCTDHYGRKTVDWSEKRVPACRRSQAFSPTCSMAMLLKDESDEQQRRACLDGEASGGVGERVRHQIVRDELRMKAMPSNRVAERAHKSEVALIMQSHNPIKAHRAYKTDSLGGREAISPQKQDSRPPDGHRKQGRCQKRPRRHLPDQYVGSDRGENE